MNIDDLLQEISVFPPDDREDAVKAGNANWPEGWYAVVDDEGIIAYIRHEADAFAYRLMLINMRLNAKGILERYLTDGK